MEIVAIYQDTNMLTSSKKLIAVVGPTASGKTGIGVKLAREFNGEIISADSRQVYRRLNIGSGKEGRPCRPESRFSKLDFRIDKEKYKINNRNIPTSKIQNLKSNLRCVDNIPQWLIDIVEPEEKFSLFDWLKLAKIAIDDIFSRGKIPIIVGGTGLYVQGLIEGFTLKQIVNDKFQTTNKNPNTKYQIPNTEQFNNLTIKQLQSLLKEVDPIAYDKIDLNNPHRLIGAIERARAGVKPIKIKPDYDVVQIGIDLPREELYRRIDERVEQRFKAGMLEEVIGLLLSGVEQEWLIKLGLEYRIITEFILENCRSSVASHKRITDNTDRWMGELKNISSSIYAIADHFRSLPEYRAMKQLLKFRIHAFARRQMTWFRRFPEIKWLKNYKEIKLYVKKSI